MRTTKSELKLGEAFNEMPGKEVIEKHLANFPYGMTIVDTDRNYWQNAEDTLVVQFDGDELYRFGGKTIADTLIGLMNFTNQTRPDEVDTDQRGAKVTVRMWWD